jgi:hypothetical protein
VAAIHYYREGASLGIYDGTPFEEGYLRVWQGDYSEGLEMMMAGAASYGYWSVDWLPDLIEVLQTNSSRDAMAEHVIGLAESGAESPLVMGELLALLNSPLFYEFVDRKSCGEYTTRFLWQPNAAELRNDPGFIPYLERMGMIEYFREFGWPDICTNENPETEGCH